MNPTSGAVCVTRTCEAEAPPLGGKPFPRTRKSGIASYACDAARRPRPLWLQVRHCACAALSFASTSSAHAQKRNCVIRMRRRRRPRPLWLQSGTAHALPLVLPVLLLRMRRSGIASSPRDYSPSTPSAQTTPPLASSPVCACAALTLQGGHAAAAWRKNFGTAASLPNRLHPLLDEWKREGNSAHGPLASRPASHLAGSTSSREHIQFNQSREKEKKKKKKKKEKTKESLERPGIHFFFFFFPYKNTSNIVFTIKEAMKPFLVKCKGTKEKVIRQTRHKPLQLFPHVYLAFVSKNFLG